MDTSAAPSPPDIDPLVHKAAHLALWLAAELRGLLAAAPGKVFGLPFLRHVLRDYLVPAEAALRRAVHLMAAGMAPLRAPPRRFRPLPRAIPVLYPVRRAPRPPVFRLTERVPAPPTDHISERLRPRIRVIGPPSPPPPPARAARVPVPFEDRLRRRAAAFHAAMKNPAAEARRLLRLRARLAAPRPLLHFAKIPGYRARPLNDEARSTLYEANTELLTHHQQRPNTS